MYVTNAFVRQRCIPRRKPPTVTPTPTPRVLKLLVLLVLLAGLQMNAGTASGQKITLSMSNVPLSKVLNELKQQSGYSMIWDEKMLSHQHTVSVDFKNISLEDALNKVLAPYALSYKIIGKMVVVKKKPAESPGNQTMIAEILPVFSVAGTIKDESDAPVEGAIISVKGVNRGTISNKEGQFAVESNTGTAEATLIITCQGFITLTVPAKNGQQLNIALKQATADLGAVMVATGIFDKKKDTYTGAAVTITAEQLKTAGNRNLLVSLRNLDASINIVENNAWGSDPNRLPELQIRGNSSIPNVNQLGDETRIGLNTPLIIIDGFESNLQRMIDMNQENVETITILKDAAAAAIYGSRGANGVIVISTKPPKAGRPGKLAVEYSGSLGVQVADLRSYRLLNARQKLEVENLAGLYTDPLYADKDIVLKQKYNKIQNDINRGVETDWLSQALRAPVNQRHSLTVSGGDRAFQYSVSLQMNNIQGAMKNAYRKLINGGVVLRYSNKKLKFTNNITLIHSAFMYSPYGNFSTYTTMNPYWAPYDSVGNLTRLLGDNGLLTLGNPLYDATLHQFDKGNDLTISNNFQFIWTVSNGFFVTGNLAINNINRETDKFLPAAHSSFLPVTDPLRKGSYDYSTSKNIDYHGMLTLNYNQQFKKHGLNAGLSSNIIENNGRSYMIRAEGFNNPNFDFLPMALQYALNSKPSGSESHVRQISLTSNATYNYNKKYAVDISTRADGNSSFGTRNRFALFWSAGARWNLHNTALLKPFRNINTLTLRASTGSLGSTKFDPYQALRIFQYNAADRYYNWIGTTLQGLGNDGLKWQQTIKNNVGINADLFNRRLSLSADLYLQNSGNLISSVNLPAANGFPSYVENIGKLQNRGVEINISYDLVSNKQKGITWRINWQIAHNSNKIVALSKAMKDAQKALESTKTTTPSRLFREGYSMSTIWAVPSLGIDPSTGKELYIDNEGKPSFNWNPAYLKAYGTTDPKYRGGINTSFIYRNFTTTVSLQYKIGGEAYNQTLVNKVENANLRLNVDARVLEERWKQPGDRAAFKGLLVTTPTYNTSRFVYDDNSLSVGNITMRYQVPPAFLKKQGIEGLNVGISIDDLLYLSSVKRERGTDSPFSKQFSLTANLMF